MFIRRRRNQPVLTEKDYCLGITVRELARMANVSIATISLVLNNKSGVGEDTRQRVLELIEQSGYVPRQSKRGTPQKRGTIRFIKLRDSGMLVDGNDEFITRLVDGVIQAASEADFDLIRSNLDISGSAAPSVAGISSPQDAGLIILASEMPASMGETLRRQLSRPYIVLDNEIHQQNDNAVTMNNEQAAFLVANHLYKLGHRRIGYVTSHNPVANHIARERGLVQAAAELGFVYDKKYRLMFSSELKGISEKAFSKMVNKPDFPTALFAANDMLALAVLDMLKSVGKRVPEDFSLVGMDNLHACTVSTPQLTSVKLPNETMGRTAILRLLAHLENPYEAPMKTFVGCDLVVRKSTCPPRKASKTNA